MSYTYQDYLNDRKKFVSESVAQDPRMLRALADAVRAKEDLIRVYKGKQPRHFGVKRCNTKKGIHLRKKRTIAKLTRIVRPFYLQLRLTRECRSFWQSIMRAPLEKEV